MYTLVALIFMAQTLDPPPDARLLPGVRPLRFEISVSKETELAQGGMSILSNLFRKHGYTLVFEQLPLMRGLEEMKKGRLDGSAGRVAATGFLYGITEYEHLVVPITYSTFSMWCHKSYANLAKKRLLKLGYMRGSVVGSNLTEFVNKKLVEVVAVNDYRVAATMLMKGRLDCMLGTERVFEDDLGGEFDLSNFMSFPLVTDAYYTWISKALLHLKKNLEDDLRAYPFPADWMKKYRSETAPCRNQFSMLCPDGIVFTQEIDLSMPQKK